MFIIYFNSSNKNQHHLPLAKEARTWTEIAGEFGDAQTIRAHKTGHFARVVARARFE